MYGMQGTVSMTTLGKLESYCNPITVHDDVQNLVDNHKID